MTKHLDTRAVYVISVAAELSGVHPQTLRIYERKGLLEPGRTSGGSRRFSEADLKQLARIQELTQTGLNLEGVKRVLALEAEIAKLQQSIDQLQITARRDIEATHRQYRREIVPLGQSPVPFNRGTSTGRR
jgi:MerR family transcriptional regulator/heat shock protein HspR